MEMGLREESSEHRWLGFVTPQGVGVKHGVQIQPFIIVAHQIYIYISPDNQINIMPALLKVDSVVQTI